MKRPPDSPGITLRQLETFHAVVVTGSVGRAARRIGLAQPTVSQQIGKLEEALGTSLFLRNRAASVTLTPAGDYWFRCAADLLRGFQSAVATYEQDFASGGLALRFGATPSLHGPFLAAAARIATESGDFGRFTFVWGIASGDLVEQMTLHQLDCAVVSDAAIRASADSFAITPLFRDPFLWVVPAAISEAAVQEALATRRDPGPALAALGRYVEVGPGVPHAAATEGWYRENLPFARPFFSCQTFQAAVDLAAAGLATCHCPLSLFPNLARETSARLRVHTLEPDAARQAVLIMPRHLASIGAFARFRDALVHYIGERYRAGMAAAESPPA